MRTSSEGTQASLEVKSHSQDENVAENYKGETVNVESENTYNYKTSYGD